MTTDNTRPPVPSTPTGRRLFTDMEPMDLWESDGVLPEDIIAIEQEAEAAERARHAALVAAATEMAQRTYVDEEGLTATVPYARLYALRKALWGSDDNIIAALNALDREEPR